MTDFELEERFAYLVKSERRITREILELICLIEERKFYLEQAYPSLFEWMVRKYGYSQAAAYRRIQAAKLLKAVPAAKVPLSEGLLNLSTLTLVQSALNKEERRTGEKISIPIKEEIVGQILGKSTEETEKLLHRQFSVKAVAVESLRSVSAEHSKLMVVIEDSAAEDLRRVKALLSHSCQTWSEVVVWLAKDYLKRKDPMRKQ